MYAMSLCVQKKPMYAMSLCVQKKPMYAMSLCVQKSIRNLKLTRREVK
jgi:hypothetical protein